MLRFARGISCAILVLCLLQGVLSSVAAQAAESMATCFLLLLVTLAFRTIELWFMFFVSCVVLTHSFSPENYSFAAEITSDTIIAGICFYYYGELKTHPIK